LNARYVVAKGDSDRQFTLRCKGQLKEATPDQRGFSLEAFHSACQGERVNQSWSASISKQVASRHCYQGLDPQRGVIGHHCRHVEQRRGRSKLFHDFAIKQPEDKSNQKASHKLSLEARGLCTSTFLVFTVTRCTFSPHA
jgi:hypothetical protein